MPKRNVVCSYGACYFSLDLDVPDGAEGQAVIDEAMSPHRLANHAAAEMAGPALGGSSPTSWPPGSLDPARVDPDRIVATHPDGSVAETKPAEMAPDGGSNPDPGVPSPEGEDAPEPKHEP